MKQITTFAYILHIQCTCTCKYRQLSAYHKVLTRSLTATPDPRLALCYGGKHSPFTRVQKCLQNGGGGTQGGNEAGNVHRQPSLLVGRNILGCVAAVCITLRWSPNLITCIYVHVVYSLHHQHSHKHTQTHTLTQTHKHTHTHTHTHTRQTHTCTHAHRHLCRHILVAIEYTVS